MRRAEWPTLVMLALCYGLWIFGTLWAGQFSVVLAVGLIALSAALHGSLTHEIVHGHPFRSCFWNAVLVFPALTITVPYLRFKDTHLAHHRESCLTDPYDDPESNYWDPAVWAQLPAWGRGLLRVNNTLIGRVLLGPAIGNWAFMRGDLRLIRDGDRRVLFSWLLHIPAVLLVIWWLWALAEIPLWAFVLGTYLAHGLLKIRTFLEHRAHEEACARTVIIEDRGPLAWLFLNNNLHVVHHMHGQVPWYELPALYRADRARYLTRNQGYVYRSYAEVIWRYFRKTKDPVPHPLWPSD
jgi:fatty acid desaturase